MPTAVTDWGSALMTSLAAALAMFLSAIPKVIGFAVILVVGWFIASLVERGVAALLRAVHFNEFANRAGFTNFLAQMRVNTDDKELREAGVHKAADPAGLIGLIVKWFVRLIAAVVAFDALGLPAVSDVLRDLLMWLPNVIVALVVLVIGGLAARALSNLVRGAAGEAGISQSNLLAKVASALVWAFAIVVAVNQIGIATTLVNTLFMAFVGAIALGLGLAFGLGGRETAGKMVNQWYEAGQRNAPKLAHAADIAGDKAREQAGSMADTMKSSSGGGSQGGGSQGGNYGGNFGSSSGGMGSGPTGGGTMGGSYQGGGSGMGGGSVGGNYGATSTGGGYVGGGTGGATSGMGSAPQYPTDGAPRVAGAGGSESRDQQMYPTPSSPRHPSEG